MQADATNVYTWSVDKLAADLQATQLVECSGDLR